jgi:DNA invertase Pin-like site-specific DNA recombinase
MAIRTGLYLRISHVDSIRSGGLSIPSQLARLREDAEKADERVVEAFVDQAKTGTEARHRSEYQRLLQWVREGKLDKVRIESVDRGHRNELDRREFEQELTKYRVILQYAGEPEKLPPALRQFNRAIRGAVAEMESGINSERVYKRLLFKLKQGKKPSGRAPFGLQLDGTGWVQPDPETYPVLLWILRRRSTGVGYMTITKELNTGISIDDGPLFIPETPNMRSWRHNPYKVWQDPETGDVQQVERQPPSGKWMIMTVRNICLEAVDGIYTGVIHWGEEYAKFAEDGEGNPKKPHRIDTGNPLVAEDILRAVQAVEMNKKGQRKRTAKYGAYLLRPTCGLCGAPMSGEAQKWSRQNKRGDTKEYLYRRYSCMGRKNRVGTCTMPRLDADYIEHYVITQVLSELEVMTPAELEHAVQETAARIRRELETGLSDVQTLMRDAQQRRNKALDTLERLEQHISERLREEYVRRAETCLVEIDELEARQRQMEAGLIRLEDNLLRVRLQVTLPLADATLWTAQEHREGLRRALDLLVKKVTVYPVPDGGTAKPERVDVELASIEDLIR